MFGGFLLILSCCASTGKTLKILDALTDIQDQPTCEELRTFWHFISHAQVMSEYTNKIPSIPITYIETGHGRRKHYNKVSADDIFYNLSPKHDDGYKRQHNHDGFLKELLTEEAIVLPDSKRREKDSWGNPHDVGLFGRFVDELPLQPEVKLPTNMIGSDIDLKSKVPCIEVENRRCVSDLECMCTPELSSMRCHWSKCRFINTGKGEDEYGTWHNGVFPQTQLGKDKDEYGTWHNGAFPRTQLGTNYKRLLN